MMKKIAVLVLVAAVISCVKAGDFQDGVEDGKWYCYDEWSGDCDDSWMIEETCKALMKDIFTVRKRDSPRTKSYKRGGRKGVKRAIRQIEKECLRTDVRQCNDLGMNAAEQIALDLCDSVSASQDYGGSRPDYKEECRYDAIDICEGNIASEFYGWCHGENLSRRKLRDGKRKCRRTVNGLLDWKLRH